ncbi:MAG: DUF3429 domain-containing protein [Pseudomonadota bacterium]|nr:DUF3429 domain-containing protein [Pseudomonadota bacterium]MEE3101189.1 DUF3429 domain-containing protein [Pseudomonadota bacterium]
MPSPRPARFGLSAAPRPAVALGLAGLVPFVALALLAHLAPIDVTLRAQYSLAAYGAAILGFLGGCRWGFAASGMGEGAAWWPLCVATTPPLLAFAALVVGDVEALWILALGLVALFAADVSLTRAGGAPAWWPALRLPLTVVAAAALVAGALA